LNVKSAFSSRVSYLSPNPLKPTTFDRHDVKSCFISVKATLSCGLLGPDTHGTTVDKSNSIIAPE
jgi:hypothetical protein